VTSSDEIRIGHVEREQAVADLRRAAEDGRLTAEELDERAERARVARTSTELAALFADLRPGTSLSATVPMPTAAQALAALANVGHRPEAPLILDAGWSGTKRTGAWVVPPFMVARAGIETVRIYCLQARAATEVIDLVVEATMGTVVLVLPDGWAVNVDRLTRGIGTVKVKVPGIPAPGCPLFLVRGSVGMGTFKARPANRLDRWRLRRQREREQRALTA